MKKRTVSSSSQIQPLYSRERSLRLPMKATGGRVRSRRYLNHRSATNRKFRRTMRRISLRYSNDVDDSPPPLTDCKLTLSLLLLLSSLLPAQLFLIACSLISEASKIIETFSTSLFNSDTPIHPLSNLFMLRTSTYCETTLGVKSSSYFEELNL